MPPSFLVQAIAVFTLGAALEYVNTPGPLDSACFQLGLLFLWLFLGWAPRPKDTVDWPPRGRALGFGCGGCLFSSVLFSGVTSLGYLQHEQQDSTIFVAGSLAGAMLAWPSRPLFTIVGGWLFGVLLSTLSFRWYVEPAHPSRAGHALIFDPTKGLICMVLAITVIMLLVALAKAPRKSEEAP